MESIVLFSNIFLFSIGCIGTASMIFLHICLKMKLTGYFSMLFSILLFSLGRVLLSLYLNNREISFSAPDFINILFGIILSLSVYVLIYFILIELNNTKKNTAVISTIFIISVQAGRTLLYYTGRIELLNMIHSAVICVISAYLFLIGLFFYRGTRPSWNPAIQRMVKSMGLGTVIFAPISAAVYISLHLLQVRDQISLDFIFMGVWAIIVVKVLLHYLSRIGTVPVSDAIDDLFIMKYKISRREKEVLVLILEGYTNKEIGEKLFISFTTARTHVSHIFEKTCVRSRIELVSKIISEQKYSNC